MKPTTADELRRDFLANGINIWGVDFDKLAAHQNDPTRLVPGWAAPALKLSEWRESDRNEDGAKYVNASRRLGAILTCNNHEDGRAWLHLSVSHRERVPSYGEMKICKELFLGDRYAYSVLPPKAKFVNLHPRALHMFAILDASALQPLPDFTGGTGSI